jgi:hypothetical protein
MLPLWALCWLLDETLFRGWKSVPVERPVFVVAGPRTGSTRLHRLLEQDAQFVSLRLVDMLLPFACVHSVSRPLVILDRALLGGSLRRALNSVIRASVPESVQRRHETDLFAAEEDDLWLQMWFQTGSFSAFLPFPHPRSTEAFGYSRLRVEEQRSIERAFRALVQKRVHSHGRRDGAWPTFLSKSHGVFRVERLRETFPDARYLVITRDPRDSVVSIATVNQDVVAWQAGLDWGAHPSLWRPYLLDYLAAYYQAERTWLEGVPGVAVMRFEDMCSRLETSVVGAYDELGLSVSDSYAAHLAREDEGQRGFVPRSDASKFETHFGVGRDRLGEYFADYITSC